MKKFVNITLITAAVCFLVYLMLITLLPFILSKKDFSYVFSNIVKKQTNLDLCIDDYKIKISPALNILFECKKLKLFYPDKKQFLEIDSLKSQISSSALVMGTLKMQTLQTDKIVLDLKLNKNGKFSLQEYLEKNYKNDNAFKISETLPHFLSKELIINLEDETTKQNFVLKADTAKLIPGFLLSDSVFSTSGKVYCKDREFFTSKIKLRFTSDFLKDFKLKPIHLTLNNLYKYKINFSLDADLKISDAKKPVVNGQINISDFTMYSQGGKLPSSAFRIIFDKNKIVIDSIFYTAIDEKAVIKAQTNFDKTKMLYLKCNAKKLRLENLKPIFLAFCDIFNIKTDFDAFDLKGFFSSDFDLSTDMKTVKSSGSLKIQNAFIKHKNLPFNIDNFNASADFSNNTIKIKDSKLFINSQPVELKGTIDKNAYANLKISAKDLNLKHILNAFDFLKPQKDLVIKSGLLSFDAKIKGPLQNISPQVNAVVTEFRAQNRNEGLFAKKAAIDIKKLSKNEINGEIKVSGLEISRRNLAKPIICNELTGLFDKDDFILKPAIFTYGKSNLTIAGRSENYLKSPETDLKVFGTIDTRLLQSFFPKDIAIYAKGELPAGARIIYKNNTLFLKANALASEKAYFGPFLIKSRQNMLFHIDAHLKNNFVNLKECSLSYAPSKIKLSDEINTSNLKKVIQMHGEIIKLNPLTFKNFNLSIPFDLAISYPDAKISANAKADLTLNGNSYDLNGFLTLTNIYAPQIYVKKIDITPEKKLIRFKLDTLKVKDTFLNIDAVANANVFKTKKINNLNVYAQKIDLQSLAALSKLLPVSKNHRGNLAPYDLISGKLNVKSATLNQIKLQNLTSDISIKENKLYLDNLRADAYRGKIAAKISYDFPHLKTHALIQARSLESGAAAMEMLPLNANVSGNLNFDSDITMTGLNPKEQMETLKGKTDILVTNAVLGPLGRFEHFLHAQNLLSQRLIYASLNSAKRAIAPKNTGYVQTMKGTLKFNNGIITLSNMTTAGPQMSMYITGLVNMSANTADLEILGKVSPDVSDSIGALGEVTIKNILDEHTTLGPAVENLFTSLNTELPETDISKIPPLTSKFAQNSKNFRVIISGNPESVKSIKSFSWVNPTGTLAHLYEKKLIQIDPDKAQETKLKQIRRVKNKKYDWNEENNTTAKPLPSQEKLPAKKQNSDKDFLKHIPNNFQN